MKSPILYRAGLGVCLTLLALSAGAKTTSGSASHEAVPVSNTATTSADAGKSTMASASNTHRHHATAHHQSHAKPKHMAASSSGRSQEAAYRSELKHCVAGPVGQRESCLDGTIARFGHA